MDDAVRTLIEEIHGTPVQVVLAVSGAGSHALAWLLGVGGASRTVIEATVPYAQSAFVAYAGKAPGEFASADAAYALARASLERARLLAAPGTPLAGIGCAATIATDRLKRGEHRAFVACVTDSGVRSWALHLEKGVRDRTGEEDLVSRVVIDAVAAACGLDRALPLKLREGEQLIEGA